MPDIIAEAQKAVINQHMDTTIASLIKKEYEKICTGKSAPQNYFYLTELVNPTNSFWGRMKPGIIRSPEQAARLAEGGRQHFLSQFWFSKLDGFEIAESNLNGYYMGVPGVVGRIDYQIAGKIFEFKTKIGEKITIDDITEKYPQDLEQLLFYAAIHPSQPILNHLIFKTRDKSGKEDFWAFDVTSKDFERIRSEMNRRVRDLSERIKTGNSKDLPTCRYYNELCQFQHHSICKCGSSKKMDTSLLFKDVHITENNKLKSSLKINYSSFSKSSSNYSIRDILLPRQWYYNLFDYAIDEDAPDYSINPEKIAAKSLLECCIRQTNLHPRKEEIYAVRKSMDQDIIAAANFIKINIPAKGTSLQIVPSICRIIQRTNMFPTVGDYDIAQLALLAGRANIPYGVVTVGYSGRVFSIMSHIVNFEENQLKRLLRIGKEQLINAHKKGMPDDLPKCPDWVTCEYTACECKIK